MNNFVEGDVTTFEKKLLEFVDGFKKLQDDENALRVRNQVANTDFQAFLRENGLPDTFTLPEALHLAIRKSRA